MFPHPQPCVSFLLAVHPPTHPSIHRCIHIHKTGRSPPPYTHNKPPTPTHPPSPHSVQLDLEANHDAVVALLQDKGFKTREYLSECTVYDGQKNLGR